ncbi:MAG: ethanolamine permease [Actinomycetota bacterium]
MADARPPEKDRISGVEYEHVGAGYLDDRKLSRHAGALLIWGLGVGYVISGEFFGWNFGMNAGGWGGLLIATIVIATMYTTMVLAISEMASALPVTGGPYAFARRALGPWGGYVTGLAVTFEYVIAPSVIAVAIGGYILGLFEAEAPFWVPYLIAAAFYAVFIGINMIGVRESLRTLFVITSISVVVLVLWGLFLLPEFSTDNLFDIAPDPSAAGSSDFLPFGFLGIWAALPAAAWFYLAIEGTPLAGEETRNPSKDLPRGTIAAMFSLIVFSAIALFLGPGAGGANNLGVNPDFTGNPNPAAVEISQGRNWLFWVTSIVGLTGLVASFFSIIFAYSRQIFALSRAGYLPRLLSPTHPRRHTPWAALIIPGLVSFLAIVIVDLINRATSAAPGQSLNDAEVSTATGDLLIQISVFSALISYALMMVAFIALRRREPSLARPYRTPGGVFTASVALVISLVALGSAFVYGAAPAITITATIVLFLVGLLYFAGYSRHRLVAEAPEEEFAVIERAEAELEES